MDQTANSQVCGLAIENVESPVDLSNEEESEIVQKDRGTKKFDKLKLSEDEIEERRRAANCMERRRMKKMSDALANLRKCIPVQHHLLHRRMSKIRTLRLAIAYIKALRDMLVNDDQRRQMIAVTQPTFPAGTMRLPHEPFSPLRNSMVIAAYAAHGAAQTPKRQLMFSPNFSFQEVPKSHFQTPGTSRHPAYQTPESYPLFGQPCFRTPISGKPVAEHTITSPEDEKEQGNQRVIGGYTLFQTSHDRSPFPVGIRQSSSCRYAAEDLDGVCPLPEDEIPRERT
ncbi:uncharacterized protein LOC130048724 [Ostrea edulis]|uniref:uncharacterized protein LOC130048724 n=1 Tax=Ostrea edulis TaxID=37623 RepID=UPI0024AF8D91|nr:uncharacterized protein LOC130048724 [Ostrea edulis]